MKVTVKYTEPVYKIEVELNQESFDQFVKGVGQTRTTELWALYQELRRVQDAK